MNLLYSALPRRAGTAALALSLALVSGCKDYLDVAPQGQLSEDAIRNDPGAAQKLVDGVYNAMYLGGFGPATRAEIADWAASMLVVRRMRWEDSGTAERGTVPLPEVVASHPSVGRAGIRCGPASAASRPCSTSPIRRPASRQTGSSICA